MDKMHLNRFADALERVTIKLGQCASWLILGMIMTTLVIVIARYVFASGWVWMQDSVIYMHATCLMLAVSYTYQRDEHVRVDILYQRAGIRQRALINLIGNIVFVMPLSLGVLYTSWPYVKISWIVKEGSMDAGGLDFVYILKAILLVFGLQLFLQSLAIIMRALHTLSMPNQHPNSEKGKIHG